MKKEKPSWARKWRTVDKAAGERKAAGKSVKRQVKSLVPGIFFCRIIRKMHAFLHENSAGNHENSASARKCAANDGVTKYANVRQKWLWRNCVGNNVRLFLISVTGTQDVCYFHINLPKTLDRFGKVCYNHQCCRENSGSNDDYDP